MLDIIGDIIRCSFRPDPFCRLARRAITSVVVQQRIWIYRPLIMRRIPFADAPCVKQLTPGSKDSKTLRADERRVGNGEKVAADPFCLIQVDRSTNDAIHHDRVACFAPAQNFYSERLTITHVPTRSPAATSPAGGAKEYFRDGRNQSDAPSRPCDAQLRRGKSGEQ
jgi:hypothetical protein